MNAALLIEIGVEELPPKAMRPLAEAFANKVVSQLDDAEFAHGEACHFASPRRLTVKIAETATKSHEKFIEKQGPDVKIAFDENGAPTRAGEGFARSVGVDIKELDVEETDKGRRLVFRGTAPGRQLAELIQPVVDNALHNLPIPKRMRWGDSDVSFVRPVHWVVALHGSEVLPLTVFGHRAGRETRGHRFHHPEIIELESADTYVSQLEDPGCVIVDIDKRRQRVLECVRKAANSLDGKALINDSLVEEVVALVEWPAGVAGRFSRQYLELPREVIIATLEGHQRYFPVEDQDGNLLPGFVTVANIDSRDPDQVVAGNERVVRPRLADALFFWEQDKQRGLSALIPELAQVSFQKKLGTLADKCDRIGLIADEISVFIKADKKEVLRSARLAKTDLLTEMVGEFPELQGTMGGYYAAIEGESEAVTRAIAEQYAPASSGAGIPSTDVGRCISMADKLDTLAGMFAIQKLPTGDRDPFGLRRAALGVLRTLIEGGLHIDLRHMLETALNAQPVEYSEDCAQALWLFHVERLRSHYVEKGVPVERFESIAALKITDMLDFDHRIKAVGEFIQLADAPIVCGAHKRIRNILKRNATDVVSDTPDSSIMTEAAEKSLFECFQKQSRVLEKAACDGDYVEALSSLAPFAEPLNTFFNEVMVMSDDLDQRGNRLALLTNIDQLCRRIADISCLSVESSQGQ